MSSQREKYDINNNVNETSDPPPKEHPLLNSDILERLFLFCKTMSNQQDYNFPALRFVCKIWDVEVCKILRKETQIPLSRLLSPYPEGLGWKWNRSRLNPVGGYQSPYPETPEFRNIKVTVGSSCMVIKNSKVIRWFTVMGSQVKSLHYSSPLNCSHKNLFLGRVLHLWCPNLETLHLSDIQCLSSLLYICEGTSPEVREFNGAFNCNKLTNLIISVESEDTSGQFFECHHKTDYTFLENRRQQIQSARRVHLFFQKLVDIYPEKNVGKKNAIFYELIENVPKLDNLVQPHLNDQLEPLFFDNNTGRLRLRKLDWGILGHILRTAPLQKIVIRKLINFQQCRDLALFLLYQPSKLRTSLEHFVIEQNVSLGEGDNPFCFKTLSMLKFPLKILHLDNLLPIQHVLDHFTDLLKECADTLNTLEIGVAEVPTDDTSPEFEIPLLPNLENFVHRNIERLGLCGVRLLTNCPKLKTCSILDMDQDNQEESLCRKYALDYFIQDLDKCYEKGFPLRELRIERNLKLGDARKLVIGLGNLVKVDFAVEGATGLEFILRRMGRWEKMENVRIRIGEEKYSVVSLDDVIIENIRQLQTVKFLDLVFNGDRVNLSVESFRNGFAKMGNLISLKMSNFGVVLEDVVESRQELEKIIARIPYTYLHYSQ